MNRHSLWRELSHFPWRNTAAVLGERFREDRLGLSASSLTFTTTIALVPFFTVALALFTAFPMFAKMQGRVQRWLVESLIPENIARQVLGYLTQFASKAGGLGVLGLAVLLLTAFALILTIDKTLNNIWRVRRPRPLAQRVLVYWAAATLGPLVLALSLSTTSYVFAASRGLVDDAGLKLVFDMAEFFLLAGGMAGLYHYVPNTEVKWSHAWAGGLFVAIAIEIAKKLLAFYFGLVPTYSVLYGAFATLPILLVWIYIAWVIVLFGAVIAAYLPSLLSGVARRGGSPGWPLQLALEALQHLAVARDAPQTKGLGAAKLVARMRVDALQLAPVLETLVALDWVGRIAEERADGEPRLVLLVDPETTALEPLLRELMMTRAEPLVALWNKGPLSELSLGDVLPKAPLTTA
ncbi:YihY family inner membrane protein [Variovorax sp. LARHSF232]